MKNAEVAKIRHGSALVGQLGQSKNSCSYFKIILCCSFPNVTPHKKFHPNRMKNTEVQKFKKIEKKKRFQKSAKTKLLELERFAWSH